MKVPSTRRMVIAGLAALWLAGCTVAVIGAFETYRRETVEDLRILSRLVMRNFDQTVRAVEYYMDDIDTHLLEARDEESRHKLLASLRMPRGMIQSTLVGLDGVTMASSRVFPTPRAPLMDREHISVHMRAQVADLFISTPVTGRISGQRTIQFSAFLPRSRAILVLSYDLADFKSSYVGIRPDGQEKTVLVGLDGKIRAGSLSAPGPSGSNVRTEDLLQAVRLAASGPLDIGRAWSMSRHVGYFTRDMSGRYALAMARDMEALAEGTLTAALPLLTVWSAIMLALTVGYRSLTGREMRRLADQEKERRFRLLQSLMQLPDFELVDPLKLDRLPREVAESFRRVAVRDHDSQFVADRWTGERGPQERLWLKIPTEDLWVAVDMTRRFAEEERAIRLARLAALGDMASGLAHEISQPLNVIRLASQNARLLVETAAEPQKIVAKLERIDAQAERAGAICQRMRIYGQRNGMPSGTVAIDEGIRTVGTLVSEMAARAGVDFEVGPLMPATSDRMSAAALEQILIAVTRNAIEACGDESRAPSGTPRVRISLSTTGDGWAVISVADNGPGIPDEIKERIWEPFFTTRRGAKNAGLGLSVVYGWLSEAGGSAAVKNGNPGTIIELRLPCSPPPDHPEWPPEEPPR